MTDSVESNNAPTLDKVNYLSIEMDGSQPLIRYTAPTRRSEESPYAFTIRCLNFYLSNKSEFETRRILTVSGLFVCLLSSVAVVLGLEALLFLACLSVVFILIHGSALLFSYLSLRQMRSRLNNPSEELIPFIEDYNSRVDDLSQLLEEQLFEYGCWDNIPKPYQKTIMRAYTRLLKEKKVVDDQISQCTHALLWQGSDKFSKVIEGELEFDSLSLGVNERLGLPPYDIPTSK